MSSSPPLTSDPKPSLAGSPEFIEIGAQKLVQKLAQGEDGKAPPAPNGKPAVVEDPKVASCPQCGSEEPWGLASWCPRCGYYPAIGKRVACTPSVEEMPQADVPPLWKLIPQWGWILAGGVLGTLVLSVLGRLGTPSGSWARTYWALGQFMVGLSILLAGHVWAYLTACMQTDRFSVFDFFLKPPPIWAISLRKLPDSRWRVWMGAWGLSMTLFALTVVGGIRYSAMFDDWGFKKQPAPNLVQAITKKAKSAVGEGNESLGGAIQDFAGDADVENPQNKAVPKPVPEAKRSVVDCVIIGYMPSPAGGEGFAQLLVATLVNGQLKFVGVVSEGISDEVRRELDRGFLKIQRKTPFVRCNYDGQWVQPTLMCRISYTSWPNRDRLKNPAFESLLANAE